MTSQANPNPDPGDLGTRTSGDIVTSIPGAVGALRRHRLDFSCRGDVSLAATRCGLDPAAVGRDLLPRESGVAAFHPGEGACNTWRALYLGVRQLADDLIEHVHTEDNGLFECYGAGASTGAHLDGSIPPGAAGHSDTARA